MDQEKLHVAIIASPGVGHLLPVLLLANRLVIHHNITTTILAVTTQTSYLESQTLVNSSHINIIKIPLPDTSNLLGEADTVFTRLTVIMREARHGIRSAISTMTPCPHVLIADLFACESLPIGNEFHMQKYVYVPCNAWFVALTTYLHVLDKEVEGEYVDWVKPLRIPGCRPVRREDLPDAMWDRSNRQYDEYVKMGVDFTTLSDGILTNTWKDMDPRCLDAFKCDETLQSFVKVPVYDIGPLTREVGVVNLKGNKVIEWLNMQPLKSVLFVSFGSGGTLSLKQITELAWGLEMSQQRFVWVVRPPPRVGNALDGAFFSARNGSDIPLDFLPEGFLTRTKELGLVIQMWAPQVDILNHGSIGGFLTHCGLNSVNESIKSGVPMIAWPLYAEQTMNATLLTEDLKVAIRSSVLPTKEVVDRDEIEKMVRRLMKGEERKAMMDNVKLLKESVKEALEINGSSYNSMCDFINCCQMKMKSNK